MRRECTIHKNEKQRRKKQYIKEFEVANFDPKVENYQSANSSLVLRYITLFWAQF